MSTEQVLTIDSLKMHFPVKGRGIVRAVDGVNLTIARGETLGLVGESGCGKSTVARCVTRIYEPTEGRIELRGKDITKLSPKQLKPYRRQMQMVFQDPYASLNPRMTVADIIAEPLRTHGIGKPAQWQEQVSEMLERVGLGREHMNRYPHEFSGGQRQRIGLARAFIMQPDLVIADEPISALDVSVQAQVVNLMMDFHDEQGISYLFIAHDLSMVRYISDRVGVMYLGQLVELCPSEEIYAHPAHPYTKALLQSVPIADPDAQREAVALEGDIPSPLNPPTGCRFHTRCPHAMPRCREEVPTMREIAPGHTAACHLL